MLRVGQVITYRPPDAGATSITHRIVAATAASYRTRGDINGADDPWDVTRSMVLSRAVAIVPGVGWIFRLVPMIGAGIVLVWLATGFVRSTQWRSAARLIGACVIVAGLETVFHPLIGYTMLSAIPSHEAMRATVVSTGVLPIQIHAVGGDDIDLTAGDVGRLLLPANRFGHVALSAALNLNLGGWLLFTGICLLPCLWTLTIGLPVSDRESQAVTIA